MPSTHDKPADQITDRPDGSPVPPSPPAPIPLGVITTCGIALLIAAGILGNIDPLFDYQATFRPGYVRKPAPGDTDGGPPPQEALAAYITQGAKIYATKCITCHGPEAKGDGSNFPPLAGSKWAIGETQRFSMIILNGLRGPMSTGKTYAAGMPSQAQGLTPEGLAGVMTYVRNHFGNHTGDVVTVDMAKSALTLSAARPHTGQQVTSEELTNDHLKALPGHSILPQSPVNPITLTPVHIPKPTLP